MDLIERFLFFPTREFEIDVARPGGPVEDVWFETSDGPRLHGWLATPPRARHTLLFFHGNAGNLADRWDNVERLMARGVRVFIIDYRGYGKSGGVPTERGLYLDARAAWAALAARPGVDPDRVFLFGRSLGGAVAIDLALEVRPRGLIVESSFESVAAMTRAIYPIVPVHMLTGRRFDSISKVPRLTVPALFVHGTRDDVVPFAQGKALYAACGSADKEFLVLANAAHNDTYLVGGDAYFARLLSFLDRWDSRGDRGR
ncbi:MAG: alpha/beta hydrolase [Myxococcales bacterium]|nr:alpha/beta hydrolase [Myxococcales bacterium]